MAVLFLAFCPSKSRKLWCAVNLTAGQSYLVFSIGKNDQFFPSNVKFKVLQAWYGSYILTAGVNHGVIEHQPLATKEHTRPVGGPKYEYMCLLLCCHATT